MSLERPREEMIAPPERCYARVQWCGPARSRAHVSCPNQQKDPARSIVSRRNHNERAGKCNFILQNEHSIHPMPAAGVQLEQRCSIAISRARSCVHMRVGHTVEEVARLMVSFIMGSFWVCDYFFLLFLLTREGIICWSCWRCWS